MKSLQALLAFLTTVSFVLAVPRSYVCYRATTPIVIDGSLSDSAWADADWTDKFVDIEGDAKPAPEFATLVKMLWDDSCIYFAAQIEEPHVWATIIKRDSIIFYDNDFEIFLDPDGDNFDYGEFEINALNTVWDLFLPKPYKDNGHPDDGWTITGLRTAVSVDGTLNDPTDRDRGWSVEVAMPWTGLSRCMKSNSAPYDGQQWRVNFSRVEWKLKIDERKYAKIPQTPEANWVWSPQGAINMHRPETWGIVQFTREPYPTKIVVEDKYASERELLHQLYYAEVEFYKQNQRWCGSLDSLVIDKHARSQWSSVVMIELTDTGYSASLPTANPDVTAVIEQDSHFYFSYVRH
jgi:hypothetical protein